MTKKKANKQPQQFPKNYRFITESKTFKTVSNYWFRLLNQSKVQQFFKFTAIVLTVLTFSVLVFGISIFSLSLFRNYQNFKEISSRRDNLQSQVNFWQSVADKYTGYKDAYFRMALLEYTLGDNEKARKNNKKALLLDPNFSDAKKLEDLLDKNY